MPSHMYAWNGREGEMVVVEEREEGRRKGGVKVGEGGVVNEQEKGRCGRGKEKGRTCLLLPQA